ncbi:MULTISPECIES: hypothetical protein [Clostridium]|uniref:AAA domain-containing protein n=1 Tax=Clostridium frigoriphilum TaxID=443253 RepID=A0ABU7UUA8_9CLOT|nr:hypothetical protein [Clostridium sp. DSM 17811]MBU3101913.1 hypothetical protein [Clostridium sp. DSM 17811]
MGRLAIRRVAYNGQKYYFESPYLNDGIIVLEGENGQGKSTFMNLIYYGLGGKVSGFNKRDKEAENKHNEIYYDVDNYVELEVTINDKNYELTRSIGDSSIYIVDSEKKVIETCVYRNKSNGDTTVFSDWILEVLGVDVFDIVQGTKKFKLNMTDLMRLIYHDQATEVDKIYKIPDNENFLSDSLEIRKAIFEVLLGEIYNDYYSVLGKYKIKLKEYEKKEAVMDSYNEFLAEILNEELGNVAHIKTIINENEEMLTKVTIERDIARSEESNASEILKEIDFERRKLNQLQGNMEELIHARSSVEQSTEKILYLIDGSEKELYEIEKIRFVNKKLKLFTPNTCPYCLREVIRDKDKCICGCEIDEEQYEKFFYTDQEYLEILKVKKKAIQSLSGLLNKKNKRLQMILNELEEYNHKINGVRSFIQDLAKDITSDYNSAYVKKIDDRICEINSNIIEYRKAEELAQKRENIAVEVTKLRNQIDGLKIKVDSYLSSAREDMLVKKKIFSEIYLDLMENADKNCYAAYVGDDYMPHINMNSYRERSASVPKRLMFFLTMLIMSLKNNVNYPRFLMIDTPNKEGIDKINLIKNLEQLSKAYELRSDPSTLFQIILTTGTGTYPESFKKYVFLTLEDDNLLLKIKTK